MPQRRESGSGAHDDSLLMIPPPGFKFIPRFENVCGKSGCFECFDIYCERCESKDRRIIELEMRNNDLAKYITQLQGKLFGPSKLQPNLQPPQTPQFQQPINLPNIQQANDPNVAAAPGGLAAAGAYGQQPPGKEPFAYIQSPVLFDPTLNLSYVATTSFSPANP